MVGESLSDCFVRTAQNCGQKTALSFFRDGKIETEISYLELNREANRIANALLDLGIKKGSRLMFYLEKSLFFVVAHVAIQKIGAVTIPLNAGYKKSEMTYLIENAAPDLVFSGPREEKTIKEIDPELRIILIDTQCSYQDLSLFRLAPNVTPRVEIEPDDPAIIVYTSGTTGKPKGAVLTHKNLVHDAKNIISTWQITESDVLCHALPFFHVHGLCFALHTALIAGSHVLLLDAFSPQRVIDILSRKEGPHECTTFMAVPSMYSKLLDVLGSEKMDFEHIRLLTSGSAPLLPKHFFRIKQVFGKEPVEREGMTETGVNFSNPLSGEKKPGSIGLPLPDLEVRIVAPKAFQDVKPGQIGEIWLKGPGVTPGYWQDPDETAESFVDGWFRTSDLGKVDKDGYYYLTDRIKHIIISGGENISPKEVEAVINRIDCVVESSVVGIPDEKWGEKVVAAVVPKSGSHVNPEEVQQFCKQHLHNWKCPKEVVLVQELPKNTMGKVLKEEVKKIFKLPAKESEKGEQWVS